MSTTNIESITKKIDTIELTTSTSQTKPQYYHIDPKSLQDTNPFISLVQNQKIINVPEFDLEYGNVHLSNVPIAYKTWGRLNSTRDNVLVICHALTGSADVSDWWGPLLGHNGDGKGKAFDYSTYFIICFNSMGSPYGSFSPLSINSETQKNYGPEFPLCTVRDDVRIQYKIMTEYFNIESVQCVIGGSMGGMLTLEYAQLCGTEFVKNFVALATSARHSAWCISWSEAQRQSIYSDPKYLNGFYSLQDPPTTGLSAARMSALLTYRSSRSFEQRFARVENVPTSSSSSSSSTSNSNSNGCSSSSSSKNNGITHCSLKIHNDGHKSTGVERKNSISSIGSSTSTASTASSTTLSINNNGTSATTKNSKAQTSFTAQSYLRYQGEKFIKRFDANCYISITRKLDTHDLQRGFDNNGTESLAQVLHKIKQKNVIIGIESDGLFTYNEQQFLADNLANSKLYKIDSMEGHDAFLLEFKQINTIIKNFLEENCKIDKESLLPSVVEEDENENEDDDERVKNSVFGESENVTNW